jgi:Protein of unknown function (DUF3617)
MGNKTFTNGGIMSRYIAIVLIAVAVFPVYSALGADGTLKITPGMYKITGSTKTNLEEKPHVKSSEVCIPESEIRPEMMLPDKDTCSIKNIKMSDNKASFDLECKGPDPASSLKGKAEYSTTPDSFKFKFDLNGIASGKELSVSSEGSAQRTGDCK